ncbi:hypothetical protein COLO4_30306 [Corchorus olitorius]|uniref:Uncharacterized protein n=1 Tax=Corchorus olitorius TaxID=93759 RepID=A0A1R3H993_9ROSI|nr:hypothetical protein COLO4_30306 [Corchorus olitorius]
MAMVADFKASHLIAHGEILSKDSWDKDFWEVVP